MADTPPAAVPEDELAPLLADQETPPATDPTAVLNHARLLAQHTSAQHDIRNSRRSHRPAVRPPFQHD